MVPKVFEPLKFDCIGNPIVGYYDLSVFERFTIIVILVGFFCTLSRTSTGKDSHIGLELFYFKFLCNTVFLSYLDWAVQSFVSLTRSLVEDFLRLTVLTKLIWQYFLLKNY